MNVNKKAPPKIDYWTSLNMHEVEMLLTTGEKLKGILIADTFNRYDVSLLVKKGKDKMERYVIRKDVIVWAKTKEGK